MYQLKLGEIVRKQRDDFSSRKTREISWRVERLKDLRKAIRENERGSQESRESSEGDFIRWGVYQ